MNIYKDPCRDTVILRLARETTTSLHYEGVCFANGLPV